MRFSSFKKQVENSTRDRQLAINCYLYMVECIKEYHTEDLITDFRNSFPKINGILEMVMINDYIIIWNKDSKLIHFSYHLNMQEHAMVYTIEYKRSRSLQWKFWQFFDMPEPDYSYDFPKDLLIYLLHFCKAKDIIRWRDVNKKWYECCNNKALWLRRSLAIQCNFDNMKDFVLFNTRIERTCGNNQLLYVAKAYLFMFHNVPHDFVPDLSVVTNYTHATLHEPIKISKGVIEDRYGPIVWFAHSKFRVRSFKSKKGYLDSYMKQWLYEYCFNYADYCLFN